MIFKALDFVAVLAIEMSILKRDHIDSLAQSGADAIGEAVTTREVVFIADAQKHCVFRWMAGFDEGEVVA